MCNYDRLFWVALVGQWLQLSYLDTVLFPKLMEEDAAAISKGLPMRY